MAGGTLLAQSTSPIPESSKYVESTAEFTATEGDLRIGQSLEIRLVSTDPLVAFNWAHSDDVRLNAVTLPSAAIGDFNGDGVLTVADTDRLTAEIAAG